MHRIRPVQNKLFRNKSGLVENNKGASMDIQDRWVETDTCMVRNIYDYVQKRDSSTLWKHKEQNFQIKVLDRCRNDPTKPMLEAIQIQKIQSCS